MKKIYRFLILFLYLINSLSKIHTVDKISEVLKIEDYIEGENEYVNKQFQFCSSSNYLYYDFKNAEEPPIGKIASLKIRTETAKVIKVGCVFTSVDVSEGEMVNLVNNAILEGKNVCLGEMQKYPGGYDALINANYAAGKNRLVIQVLYGLGGQKEERRKIRR